MVWVSNKVETFSQYNNTIFQLHEFYLRKGLQLLYYIQFLMVYNIYK
jgi:hypothetical protein